MYMRNVLEAFGKELTDPTEKAAFDEAFSKLEFTGPHADSVTHGRELSDLPNGLRAKLHARYIDIYGGLEERYVPLRDRKPSASA